MVWPAWLQLEGVWGLQTSFFQNLSVVYKADRALNIFRNMTLFTLKSLFISLGYSRLGAMLQPWSIWQEPESTPEVAETCPVSSYYLCLCLELIYMPLSNILRIVGSCQYWHFMELALSWFAVDSMDLQWFMVSLPSCWVFTRFPSIDQRTLIPMRRVTSLAPGRSGLGRHPKGAPWRRPASSHMR